MNNRRASFFNVVLIAVASLVVGMVIAARLDLTPSSLAGTFNTPTVNTAPIAGAIDATTFRNIAKETSPAVVSISIRARVPAQQSFGDIFGLNGRNRNNGRTPPQEILEGAGSGFVIDKSGLILTNNHVVDEAETISVQFSDSRGIDDTYPATVVGRDQLTDTALIKLTRLPDHPITEAKFGDSSQMAPGDWVMAIGNPYRLANTVTVGIVSAVGRPYQASVSANGQGARTEEMIQTDAAINRGNSGGPLLNIRGEVVGINTMIYSDSSGGNLGIGFAVPINKVVSLLPQLREGKVVRGRIGVGLAPERITPEDAQDRGLPSAAGAIVKSVDDGPARVAGMKKDDVVIEYNGKPVRNNDELIGMVTATTPGTTVPVKVVRDKKTMTLNVKVAELDLAAEEGRDAGAAPPASRAESASKDTGFGMTIQDLTPSVARQLNFQGKAGAVVSAIDPMGQAAQAGLAVGDIIISVNSTPTTTLDQVSKALDAVESNHTARIVVSRRGEEQLLLPRKR